MASLPTPPTRCDSDMHRVNSVLRANKGFSLIELFITLACIGIVISWGVPHYQGLLQRQQRASARTALLQTAHWLERYASAHGSYPLPSQISPELPRTAELHYHISVDSTPNSYLVYATPVSTQILDPCGTLTLSHTGLRGVKHATASTHICWQQ